MTSADAASTGGANAISVPSPAWAVEQMEQTWCGLAESSWCVCAAWATPIAQTTTATSMQTTRTVNPRLREVLIKIAAAKTLLGDFQAWLGPAAPPPRILLHNQFDFT